MDVSNAHHSLPVRCNCLFVFRQSGILPYTASGARRIVVITNFHRISFSPVRSKSILVFAVREKNVLSVCDSFSNEIVLCSWVKLPYRFYFFLWEFSLWSNTINFCFYTVLPRPHGYWEILKYFLVAWKDVTEPTRCILPRQIPALRCFEGGNK